MALQPSAIRRPVVTYPGGLLVGFDPAAWHVLQGRSADWLRAPS